MLGHLTVREHWACPSLPTLQFFFQENMPFRYKKKSNRIEIPRDIIERAIDDVHAGAQILPTAKKYEIPRSSLQRYLKLEGPLKNTDEKYITRKIFTTDEEKALGEYLIRCSQLHYGMTKLNCRKFAYEYAVANGKVIPENWKQHKYASKDWIRGFMIRNKNLSLRTPEATSLSRATSFNRKNVTEFFDNYRSVLDRYKFGPEAIYNIDETGLTTVQSTQKVLAVKGCKQVGQMTSAERGTLITLCCTINAIGNSIPPFYIFPRVNFRPYMLSGAPVGSDGAAYTSGWMTVQNFVLYLKHFIKYVKPSKTSPVAILLDNHESHISIEALDLCKENGIVMVTFPPHCSHKLQPLDLTVFGPLKRYYNIALTDWLSMNPSKTCTIYEIAKLSALAIPQAFTPTNIQHGFEKSGIWPFNSEVFTDADFLSSYVTDRPMLIEQEEDVVANSGQEQPATSTTDSHFHVTGSEVNTPSTSASALLQAAQERQTNTPNNEPFLTPETVRPYPKAQPRKNVKNKRKKGKSRIMTDTPEKLLIEQQTAEKKRKLPVKKIPKLSNELQTPKKERNVKKRKESTSSESLKDESFSSGSSSEWNEFEDESEKEVDVDDVICLDRSFQIGDYVLVKFPMKKTSVHYVGKIEEMENNNFTINFMRLTKFKNTFCYPDIKDVSWITRNDIITKLPTPTILTRRGSPKYLFDKPLWVIENLK